MSIKDLMIELQDFREELQADNDAALAKMQEQERQEKYQDAYDMYKEEGYSDNYCHEMALLHIGDNK